jgi:TRAP-type C4-dicarboxylate transport system permease large subunit
VVALPVNRQLIMVFIALIYLAGGSFLDDLAVMILATPIFIPAVVKLGFDPLWFGMLIAITVEARVVEEHAATVLYHTAYNPYFRTNRKVFRATDFITELLQHLPDPRL